MIKAIGQYGDRPLALFGLSKENITRLVAGEPITFDMAELGFPACRVVIMYGQTEQDIVAEIQSHGVQPGFRCPRCRRVSCHPDDLAEGYCGACHDYTGRARPNEGATGGH